MLGGLGGVTLGAWLGGCATPTAAPLRPIDPAMAPRAGDAWRYEFRSVFRLPAARTLEVRVLEAGPEGVRDRFAVEDGADGDERAFTSALEMAERPLLPPRRLVDRLVPTLTVVEFSPYLLAFGALPDDGPVATPMPNAGPAFTGRARLRGNERVTVPAGSFDAIRMDFDISRTPSVTLRPRLDPVWTLGTVWYAPAVKRPVRWTIVTRASERNVVADDTYELASYRPG